MLRSGSSTRTEAGTQSRVLSGTPAEASPGPGPQEVLGSLGVHAPGTLGLLHISTLHCNLRGPRLSASTWLHMAADAVKRWWTLQCHLPSTLSIFVSLRSIQECPLGFKLGSPPGISPVILLISSSFESQLQAPLHDTMACLPLSSHSTPFPLAASCSEVSLDF